MIGEFKGPDGLIVKAFQAGVERAPDWWMPEDERPILPFGYWITSDKPNDLIAHEDFIKYYEPL